MADKNEMLAKVRALLAKADGTTFPEEADAFRQKAEALMLKYRIDEWELGSEREDNVPGSRVMDFQWYWDSQHGGFLWSMALTVAYHCRVTVVTHKAGRTIPVVGLPSDVDYFDMLFTSLMMEMGRGLEPQPDPTKPMIENLVLLKEAGQQWERIMTQLREIGQLTDEQFTLFKDASGHTRKPWRESEIELRRSQIKRLNFAGKYTAYCKKHDRNRLKVTPKMYQRSFAYGFTQRISERLSEMRNYARQEMGAESGSGMDLVLADIRTRVRHKAIELYGEAPQYKGRARKAKAMTIDAGAVRTGRSAADRVDLGSTKISQGRGALPR